MRLGVLRLSYVLLLWAPNTLHTWYTDEILKFSSTQECGMISEVYKQAPPVKNLFLIVTKEITLHGFIMTSLINKYAERFYTEAPVLIADGTIKYEEERSMGLHTVGHAIRAVLSGENKGKSVVIITEE
jgi:NADPH-dependent curcumin reductase CurA